MPALARAAIALCAMAAAATIGAQTPAWPSKPVRLVVPYVPGGYTDTYSRLIAAELGKALGQQVIVENKAGNSGNVGSELVAKAAPDGYTLLMGGMSTHAIAGSLVRDLPFDMVRDFTPVAPVVWASSLLLVNPSVPVANVGDLVALARAKPGTLTYGSAGIGTPGHLNVEWLKGRTGIRMDHIPYKGEADVQLALLRGDIALASMSVTTALPNVKAGKLRPIALAADARSPALPDVPTLAESWPGVGSGSWIGLFAPAGAPDDVVQRVNREVDRIMRAPEMTARLATGDLTHRSMTPAEFAAFQKAEIAKWGAIVRDNGIRLD